MPHMGSMWPPPTRTGRLGITLTVITTVGFNLMLIKNNSHPRSLTSKSDLVITFERIKPLFMIDPHFFIFGMPFSIKYISRVFGVKKGRSDLIFQKRPKINLFWIKLLRCLLIGVWYIQLIHKMVFRTLFKSFFFGKKGDEDFSFQLKYWE